MESDTILSLSTSGRGTRRTTVTPSPVLDLIYACYHLKRRRVDDAGRLAWAEAVQRDAPAIARDAAALADSEAGKGPGRILFAVAIEFGYIGDEDPRRFLDDLPSLAVALRARLAAAAEDDRADDRAAGGAAGDGATAAMAAWLDAPPAPDWAERAVATLRALWGEIGPDWERRGRAAAEAAAGEVRAALADHGDVLRALPAHHFAQFETLAPSLRAAHARGSLWVVPLAFASAGGFHIDAEEVVALGFGLHAERLHASAERQVAAAAAGAKAFADPTRLMLLRLITQFEGVTVTVGDLAAQLGVSQPTVSGHLKQLRQAGLVTTERKGNRTVPRPVPERIRAALDALSEVVADASD